MPADNSPQGQLIQSMGGAGGKYVTTAAPHSTGSFFAIHALTATTLGASESNISGVTLVGAVIPEGGTMFGAFSEVSITAGTAVLYNYFD